MATMLEVAVSLVHDGMHIFPLRPGSKGTFRNCQRCRDGHCDPQRCPCLTADQPCHGLLAATTNLDPVNRWWNRCPRANIGINTGRSGLVVLDLDCKPKPPAPAAPDFPRIVNNGIQTFNVLTGEPEGSAWPDTMDVGTPSGGLHLYFRCPPGLRVPSDATGRVGYQIDVRAQGGYVLAPGSVLTSPPEEIAGKYVELNFLGLLEPPEWLCRRVMPPTPPDLSAGKLQTPNYGGARRGDHAPGYFRRIWDAELSKVEYRDGERWRLLYNAARRLANLATHDTAPWTEAQVLHALVAAAVRRRQHTGKPLEETTARRNAVRGWQRGTQDGPDCLLGWGSAA